MHVSLSFVLLSSALISLFFKFRNSKLGFHGPFLYIKCSDSCDNGTIFTFYSTGFKKGSIISNYKLFLMANINGRNFNQLLFSTATFGVGMENESDENVTIEFVGDIDGDQIPDLILSESGNFYGYTDLFLSKPASNTAILKEVAVFGGSD